VPIGQNGLVKTGWYYYTHGVAKVNVIETGEQLADRTPGWLNAEHKSDSASTSGNLQLHFPVETEWLCIPHAYNKKGLPSLASVIIQPDTPTMLENGSDIFLVRGSLNIKGKIFVGPTQIRIRSGDVEARVEGSAACYAMRFLNEN
jgi:hypothetical protein